LIIHYLKLSLIELSIGVGAPSSSTLTKVEFVSQTTTSSKISYD